MARGPDDAKKDRKKRGMVVVKARRQNMTPEERRLDKLTRKDEAKKVRETAREKMREMLCPLCQVVVESWKEHHEGSLHQSSRKLLKPKEILDIYLRKEKMLERKEQRQAKKADKLAQKASAKRVQAEQGGKQEEDEAKEEATTAEALANDPWRRCRRIKNGHLQVMCNICVKWVNLTGIRGHNSSERHVKKMEAMSPEDRSAYFSARLSDKAHKAESVARRAKAVIEPKLNFSTLKAYADALKEGRRI